MELVRELEGGCRGGCLYRNQQVASGRELPHWTYPPNDAHIYKRSLGMALERERNKVILNLSSHRVLSSRVPLAIFDRKHPFWERISFFAEKPLHAFDEITRSGSKTLVQNGVGTGTLSVAKAPAGEQCTLAKLDHWKGLSDTSSARSSLT